MTTSLVLQDLLDEQAALDDVVAELDPGQWAVQTPSPGWTVAHQIAHLTYFDLAAATAITDPEEFARSRDELFTVGLANPELVDDLTLGEFLKLTPAELLTAWREGRSRLAEAAATLAEGDRVEWYGPSMSGRSFLTARLMEAWAHGQDIVDAIVESGGSARRPPSERLRHIAHLGVVTRGWSYSVRGDESPEAEIRVEVVSPAGETWAWGPESGAELVSGPAEDFCLVVTQRRNIADTALVVEGEAAADWMRVAQAFAGGATEGPAPRDR